MSRIDEVFSKRGVDGKRALVGFVTAGDPTIEHTVPAMRGLVEGGVDILELGVPFSDPEAEGPTIQRSSERALANGVTLRKVLELVQEFRKEDDTTAIALMGYLNSVLAMPDFAEAASAAGVDGLIMVNLPPEEAQDIQADLAAHDIDLIYLLAPTTTRERAQYILSKASGFAYYVSLKGITGAALLQTDEVAERLRELRSLTEVPLCVGFGIKDADTAAKAGVCADGVVVGSALVNIMAEAAAPAETAAALRDAAGELRKGLDALG
jgi:tryptophan synthase alpha chain